MTDGTETLPRNIVRLSWRPDGIELYFPPLRTPEIALALGLFGAVCLALPLFALSGSLSIGGSTAHSLLAIALLGAFVAPFPVFGAVFVVIAVYMLANSLTVSVTPSAIRTVRRVFGLVLSRRELKRAEIAAIEAQIAAKYQSLFSAEPYFRLVARRTRRGEARGREGAQATDTTPPFARDPLEEEDARRTRRGEARGRESAQVTDTMPPLARDPLAARHAKLHKNDLVMAESLKGEALTAQVLTLITRHAGLAGDSMKA